MGYVKKDRSIEVKYKIGLDSKFWFPTLTLTCTTIFAMIQAIHKILVASKIMVCRLYCRL